MERIKHFAKLAALNLGLEIHRAGEFGGDPFRDMRQLTPATRPVIFDVGANIGQTVQHFRWIAQHRIGLIFLEITFSQMYE